MSARHCLVKIRERKTEDILVDFMVDKQDFDIKL